jgi:hypothetical protein
MRIALVLKGHYRSLDKTHKIWLDALKGHNYDCYFHTWDLQDATTPTWYRGEKYALPLYPSNIELLKKFDKDIIIESQTFTEEDIKNIYIDAPYKTFIYRYESLYMTLNRIDVNKYDIVIVGRYDLELKDTCFSEIIINKNEILIGGIKDERYYKGLRATDLLFAFHPENIPLFQVNPYVDIDSFKNGGEEPFTKFLFENFKKISLKWNYETDFNIKR